MKKLVFWLGFFFCLSATVFTTLAVWNLGTFEAALSWITALSGTAWCISKLKQRGSTGLVEKKHVIQRVIDYTGSFFAVFLIVFILRSFLLEPFRIPTGSMIPNLHIGDFVLVSKFSYGLRAPVLGYRLFGDGEPQRGDVVVFRFPMQPDIDYIKRLVGLPGDEIIMIGDAVYINGRVVRTERVGTYEGSQQKYIGSAARLEKEFFDNGSHYIVKTGTQVDVPLRIKVPERHYFFLGDNRDNSNDSRYWGFVSDDMLKGRAFFIWMNWSDSGFDFSRIGTSIH